MQRHDGLDPVASWASNFSPSTSVRITRSGVCERLLGAQPSWPHSGAWDSHGGWLGSWGPGHHNGSDNSTFFRFVTDEPLLVPYLEVILLYQA